MSPPLLASSPTNPILAVPLTPENFKPYGTAITSPLPTDLTTFPSTLSDFPSLHSAPVSANQGSSVKYSPISTFHESYGTNGSQRKGSPRMSMFSCFPRELRRPSSTTDASASYASNGGNDSGLFDLRFLERHPFTSQTFIPLTHSRDTSTESHGKAEGNGRNDEDVMYLVIVAPTLVDQTKSATIVDEDGDKSTVSISNPPDLGSLCAFIVTPGQAVTYAAGTWHAPMVVLGKQRIDFVVVQFMNEIDVEDCELVGLGDGHVINVNPKVEIPRRLNSKL